MSRSHLHRSKDLIATVAATVIAIVVALMFESGPLAVAALLPLVLVLPGYALAAVLFPPGTIDRSLRVALVVALSVAATALSGLALQVFVDLGRGVVAAALAGITIAAALAALPRRKAGRDERAPAGVPTPLLFLPSGLALVAAVAISGIAIAIASDGARSDLEDSHFSSLWMLPKGEPGTPANGPPVVVGVSNDEGRETPYLLRVGEGPSTIGEWSFRLDSGEEWEIPLPAAELQGSGRLVARLDRRGEPYRRVALELDFRADGGGDG